MRSDWTNSAGVHGGANLWTLPYEDMESRGAAAALTSVKTHRYSFVRCNLNGGSNTKANGLAIENIPEETDFVVGVRLGHWYTGPLLPSQTASYRFGLAFSSSQTTAAVPWAGVELVRAGTMANIQVVGVLQSASNWNTISGSGAPTFVGGVTSGYAGEAGVDLWLVREGKDIKCFATSLYGSGGVHIATHTGFSDAAGSIVVRMCDTLSTDDNYVDILAYCPSVAQMSFPPVLL